MPECAVCSSPAPFSCARCKSVSYCSSAHQKEDWAAHKANCPRLAREALSALFHPCDEELLLRITTCLAQNGYHKEVGVMVQLNKVFWTDEQIWDAYKDVPGAGGKTRLMYASMRGWLRRVKWLQARGTKVNIAGVFDGNSALMQACDFSHPEVVKVLLDMGAHVNASRTDGSTALLWACKRNAMETYRRACELTNASYAAIAAGNGKDSPSLKECREKNRDLDIVRLLLDRGATMNATRTDGQTALLNASEAGNLEVVRELLARGASVNAARMDGQTALTQASQGDKLEVVSLLLDKGADVTAANTLGVTSLMMASANSHLEIVRTLLNRGAKKSTTCLAGHTAFDLASGPQKAALEALLQP